MRRQVAVAIERVRSRQPLVHCLTGAVSMELVADALLAAGARPMMSVALPDATHMASRADAVLANLATLDSDGHAGIPATAAVAAQRAIPWVLDPAAAGASPPRLALARELLALRPTVLRANASEVLALADAAPGGRGADSVHDPGQALDAACALARTHGSVVAVSGAVDLLTDGRQLVRLRNGHPMLTRVTGTGCTLGALVAACCSVAEPLAAAVAATAWLSVAGERAAACSAGPGSFRVALLDCLYSLSSSEVACSLEVETCST